jgi:hypothetical protein
MTEESNKQSLEFHNHLSAAYFSSSKFHLSAIMTLEGGNDTLSQKVCNNHQMCVV